MAKKKRDTVLAPGGVLGRYVLARVKQWLRIGNYDGKLTLFDTLKRCDDLVR